MQTAVDVHTATVAGQVSPWPDCPAPGCGQLLTCGQLAGIARCGFDCSATCISVCRNGGHGVSERWTHSSGTVDTVF
ncbi:hypothetical protein [Kibdelosporangium philippinense]|uniref:hypothetical protein n=1 Tax=Kibdelosporangium philippinense TaxID=211113 RepID=UPI0036163160